MPEDSVLGGGSLLPLLDGIRGKDGAKQGRGNGFVGYCRYLFIYLNPNLYSAAKKCHSGGHEAYLAL